ncbi:tyrosine-type recombinase/integrase, partial [Pseudarthrobacter sp. NKDBFgelt]
RPVGAAALDELKRASMLCGRAAHVLPAVRRDGAFGGLPGAWKRIASRAGFTDVTPHTLRHSFASVAADLGYSEITIAALLGHSVRTVTSRYVHHLDAVLVAAADAVAAEINLQMFS